MALQYDHSYTVKHIMYINGLDSYGNTYHTDLINGYVQFRILDYKIVRTGESSSSDWLFK